MRIWGRHVRWADLLSEGTLKRWPDDIVICSIEREPEVKTERRIVVTESLWGRDLLDVTLDRKQRHVVQMDHPDFEHAVNMAALALMRPKDFASETCRVMSEMLGHATPARFGFRRATNKHELLERIEAYVSGVSVNPAVSSSVRSVADEMFTNAVLGRQKGAVPRLDDLKLKGEIFLLHDSDRLVVGCEDNRGSLAPTPVLKRIQECYEKGASNVINLTGQGGAGIGCYLIMEHSTSFFMSVVPGEKSVVLAMMPLKMHLKRLHSTPKNIHLLNFVGSNEQIS